MFYLMGGPMLGAQQACIDEGMRGIDVRHEQAAAMMAHAYARTTNKVGVCMAASGPGVTNLITGMANALHDCAPILAVGGASPMNMWGRGVFQEMDQVALFRPVTKWAERIIDIRRIPDMVATAMRQAQEGKPGPVYLDIGGDVLYDAIDENEIEYPDPEQARARFRAAAHPDAVRAAIELIQSSSKPIAIFGSGVLWSGASSELNAFVDRFQMPFYPTPQGRGAVPDDHSLSFPGARSTAFREADLLVVVGTRANYINAHLAAPRFSPQAKLIHVNIDPMEIGITRSCDLGMVGDVKTVLRQLLDAGAGGVSVEHYSSWIEYLRQVDGKRQRQMQELMSRDSRPIHPLRLCKEIGEFLNRDAILVVDGQEILNYGRQSLQSFQPGHRLNSGPFGTMGVGLPFGIGAKVAHPDKQVLVLHGDGSFGLNAMELDTAVRFDIPVVTVISLNGGWTADEAERPKPGRYLGYQRYDKMAEVLGCHGEYVEDPEDIKPALERAFESGRPAVVNVVTDSTARANTSKFTTYST